MDIDFRNFADDLEMAEDELLDNMVTLEKAHEKMKEAQELYKVLEKRMKSGWWDEDVLLVKKWRETAKRAAQLYVLAKGGAGIPFAFTDHIDYLYDFGNRKGEGIQGGMQGGMQSGMQGGMQSGMQGGMQSGMRGEAKWRIRIEVMEEYYDNSIYYSRNYISVKANMSISNL